MCVPLHRAGTHSPLPLLPLPQVLHGTDALIPLLPLLPLPQVLHGTDALLRLFDTVGLGWAARISELPIINK